MPSPFITCLLVAALCAAITGFAAVALTIAGLCALFEWVLPGVLQE